MEWNKNSKDQKTPAKLRSHFNFFFFFLCVSCCFCLETSKEAWGEESYPFVLFLLFLGWNFTKRKGTKMESFEIVKFYEIFIFIAQYHAISIMCHNKHIEFLVKAIVSKEKTFQFFPFFCQCLLSNENCFHSFFAFSQKEKEKSQLKILFTT